MVADVTEFPGAADMVADVTEFLGQLGGLFNLNGRLRKI